LRLRFNGKPEMVVALFFVRSPKKFAATWRNWASVRSPNFALVRIVSKQIRPRRAARHSRLKPARVVPQQTPYRNPAARK